MADKPLVWLGSSLDDLRAFPDEARQEAGFQLRRVQKGLAPADRKPLATVGPGVIEIRIHTAQEYGVFYVAKFAEAVYVWLRQAKPGKGGREDVAAVTRKLFVRNLAGTQACPAKAGPQPEASLAWWWGDPSCEA
ncbi:MAG TPA: type II toxin-antitoxin system RelE/ParE family toxin [Candidatus Binatia bacterium]|nr:type II toxin-antitoxin system RelE/ParE family toxin [Candidatus Binatia bacterium]